jgi:hypothetical protein
MSAKKVKSPPFQTELTLRIVDDGVVVMPRPITPEESSSADHVGVVIMQKPSRYRNQDHFEAHLFRNNPQPQGKVIESQRFSKKGDPALRADAFFTVLGATVSAAL